MTDAEKARQWTRRKALYATDADISATVGDEKHVCGRCATEYRVDFAVSESLSPDLIGHVLERALRSASERLMHENYDAISRAITELLLDKSYVKPILDAAIREAALEHVRAILAEEPRQAWAPFINLMRGL